MIKFTYYGEVRGKGRPRFRSMGKFVSTYTPKETKAYEMSIKEAYLNQSDCTYFNEEPLILTITIYQATPKSASKKKTKEMLERRIRPTKKPDIDNILKSVCDSLNMVAYKDDTQIVEITAKKYYSDRDYMEVEIKSLEEGV